MDLSKKYVIWNEKVIPKGYAVHAIGDVESIKGYELRDGKSLLKRWPEYGVCEVIDGDPHEPVFADSLINTDSQIIISERLKEAMEEAQVNNVEFLPVKLKEEKQTFDTTYYIAHLLNLPDCLDLEASGAKMSNMDKTQVMFLKKLAFKDDPELDIFRPVNYGNVTIVSLSLATKLSAKGFSGLSWMPLSDHTERDEKPSPIVNEIETLNKEIAKGKPLTLSGSKKKATKLMDIPHDEIKEFYASLPKKAEVHDEKGNEESITPASGDENWLDVYEMDGPDNYPAFNPKRYYFIGRTEQSNAWLMDLETGAIVYYTHELGYNRKNFEVVAKNLKEFGKLIKAR